MQHKKLVDFISARSAFRINEKLASTLTPEERERFTPILPVGISAPSQLVKMTRLPWGTCAKILRGEPLKLREATRVMEWLDYAPANTHPQGPVGWLYINFPEAISGAELTRGLT